MRHAMAARRAQEGRVHQAYLQKYVLSAAPQCNPHPFDDASPHPELSVS